MDNFEWAEGYTHRFASVDFAERRLKHSGVWYRDFLTQA